MNSIKKQQKQAYIRLGNVWHFFQQQKAAAAQNAQESPGETQKDGNEAETKWRSFLQELR